MMKGPSRLLLTLIATLVSGQILWWAYLIISQQYTIAESLGTAQAATEAQRYEIMIISEAIFFFIILSLGLFIAHRSLKNNFKTQQMQSDFLSAVTHELKTPLANVRLCLDTLGREQLGADAREKYRIRAQRSVDGLIDEVETILTLVNRGQIAQNITDINLHQLTKEVVEQFDEELTKTLTINAHHQIEVRSSYPESRLILKSLIDNAIRYSLIDDVPGNITITIDQVNDKARIQISDTGIGFKPDDLKQAFDHFFRGEQGRQLSPNGTGLGLPLVKRLCDALGISVWLESKGPGQGTTAFLLWPNSRQVKHG